MGRRYHNGIKTFGLFMVLWVVLLAVGGLVARGTGNALWIWGFALFGLASTAWSYWNSASIALRSMNAREVSEAERPELYRIVRELSQRANQPMPTIWVAPTQTPNAFATGRNPKNAAVVATRPLLDLLNDEELEDSGVTADTVRLSVGIESIGDILADIDQALAKAS